MSDKPASGRGGLRDASISAVAVVCPSWVGDVIMCTPVLRALRHHLPEARIIAVARPGLNEILAGAPWIDAIVMDAMSGVFGPIRTGGVIRQSGAQAVLLLPNSMRSAIAARASGARVRIGYDRDGRRRLLTHGLKSPPRTRPVATVDYYRELAAWALDVDVHDIDARLELFVTDEQRAAAETALQGVGERFVVLNPGGNKPQKRWPPDRFARAADSLRREHGVDVIVTGAPGERDVLDAVAAAAESPIVNLQERGVGLGPLKEVIRRSMLLITNDTGPRHIAAAVGTPVVTLFGPTDHRWTTLAGIREHVLTAEPFLTDDQVANDAPDFCRVDRITVGDVLSAASRLLESEGGGESKPATPGVSASTMPS